MVTYKTNIVRYLFLFIFLVPFSGFANPQKLFKVTMETRCFGGTGTEFVVNGSYPVGTQFEWFFDMDFPTQSVITTNTSTVYSYTNQSKTIYFVKLKITNGNPYINKEETQVIEIRNLKI